MLRHAPDIGRHGLIPFGRKASERTPEARSKSRPSYSRGGESGLYLPGAPRDPAQRGREGVKKGGSHILTHREGGDSILIARPSSL